MHTMIRTLCLCYLTACGALLAAEREPPLNILLLYADDWRHDTLGVAGHPIVQTPEIDKLAKQGVRFSANYVTTSICAVSRASLFTGQWMSRHGCRGFTMWSETTPWSETLPGLLKDRGYYLGHVGKWHNGKKYPADKYDYSRFYHGKHWYDIKGDLRKVHVTQRNENDALEFLSDRPIDKPFFLMVSFFAPHAQDNHPLQFLPQAESLNLYQDVTVPMPENATEASWQRLPDFFTEKNEGRNRWHWRFDSPGKYQEMMKNYYRLATEVDATCGRLINELTKQGALDNTLVIFTTDNGYYHAEHGLADKWYPHEESIRVPLVIRDPRMADGQQGSVNDAMTLNVDLAPTVLTAAGIEVPEKMQGADISQLYLSENPTNWRTEFFYEHPMHRSIDFISASEALVRKDWKYMFWPEHGVEQLFDLTNDPIEENDLVNNPEHATRLAEMRARFAELKAAAK